MNIKGESKKFYVEDCTNGKKGTGTPPDKVTSLEPHQDKDKVAKDGNSRIILESWNPA